MLTDVLMPFLDGAGMARAIRRLNPAARMLVSTGATVGGGVENKLAELQQLGITTVLLKPYSSATLLREVRHALHPPDGKQA